MKAFSKRSKSDIYLEYVNGWLTVDVMGENYNRSGKSMGKIIKEGKKEYENNNNTIL